MQFLAKAKEKVRELTFRGADRRGIAGGSEPSPNASPLSSQSNSDSYHRIEALRQLLAEPVVDVEKLRRVAWFGSPDVLRASVWCILLDYWPSNSEHRDVVVARKRAEYGDVVSRHYANREWNTVLESSSATTSDALVGTDEIAILRQIRKDIPRTANTIPAVSNDRAQGMLERILFVWAVRHPASGYVQGMNDLVLPFFYTLLADRTTVKNHEQMRDGAETMSIGWSVRQILQWTHDEVEAAFNSISDAAIAELEADTYWLVSTFLSMVQDNFTYNQRGTHAMVAKLQRVMTTTDPALTMHLNELGIKFLEFAFRWMNCLLLREMSPSQALRLFDTYICEGLEFADLHIYVCAALLRRWSSIIVGSSDFVFVMHFLQAPPTQTLTPRDIDELCSSAYLLQQMYTTSLGPRGGEAESKAAAD